MEYADSGCFSPEWVNGEPLGEPKVRLTLPYPKEFRVRRPSLSYANVVSTIALVLAVGGGTAYASGLITTDQIAARAVTNAKVATGAVNSRTIAPGQVWNTHIASGAINTRTLADGSVTSTKLAAGAVGSTSIADGSVSLGKLDANTQDTLGHPRAWGHITAPWDGIDGPTLVGGHNIVSVNYGGNPFCVVLDPSIDATTAQVIVSPDASGDWSFGGPITNVNAHPIYAYWDSANANSTQCAGNAVAVNTGFFQDSGNAMGQDVGMTPHVESFEIMVL